MSDDHKHPEPAYDYQQAALETTQEPLGLLLPAFWMAAYLPMAVFLFAIPFLM